MDDEPLPASSVWPFRCQLAGDYTMKTFRRGGVLFEVVITRMKETFLDGDDTDSTEPSDKSLLKSRLLIEVVSFCSIEGRIVIEVTADEFPDRKFSCEGQLTTLCVQLILSRYQHWQYAQIYNSTAHQENLSAPSSHLNLIQSNII